MVLLRFSSDQIGSSEEEASITIGNDSSIISDGGLGIEIVGLKLFNLNELKKKIHTDIKNPKNIKKIDYKIDDYDKGNFDYFMHKEIHEQINTIPNTINGRVKNGSILLQGLSDHWNKIESAEKIYITACGTSWHAGLIGKNFIERFANIPVHVEYASEFRYNHTLIDSKTVVIAISQSGETADTLAAISKANDHGALTMGICNVAGSSVSRETECGIYTRLSLIHISEPTRPY